MKTILVAMRVALMVTVAIVCNSVSYAWDYFDGTYIWSFTRANSCATLEGSGGRGVSYGVNYSDGGDAYADSIEVGGAPIGTISVPTAVCINTNGRDGDEFYPVIGLGRNVFLNCFRLTDIVIPNCISSIGDNCFRGCIGLTTLRLPESIGGIGSFAFQYCSNITSMTLPQGLTSIGRGVFMECTSLSFIELPANIDEVPYEAFSGCSSLANISLPNGLATIGVRAFQDCVSLKYVVIPESVITVGASVFKGCTGLKKVFVPITLKGKLGVINNRETAFDDFSVVEYYDSTASQLISTSDGAVISIEKSWLEESGSTFLIASGGDYEAAATSTAANGMKVWECYVAGLDPTNANSRFKAKIEVKDGAPTVTWTPNLNESERTRVYTIYGKESLGDSEDWISPTNSLHRFFKVGVEML